MTDHTLSPAAQAVLDASNLHPYIDSRQILAAALRAAINQVLPIEHEIIDDCWYEKADPIREQFLAITDELEGNR